ncbi:Pkinase-domain-containing protein [Hanseniaspora valbyensis NRRL Y-1626]|uniref:non-specific serine/threonine protein kinase n=1 Tax=Hanseniaspora valbyensis NRRL Y-1626 TaxID=766949 RepID=A0A1B7TCF4_9ASCO|nr:Pkinase-domain-containing protein [Hanseniaspora valbyensis NRRL Y-1626]
MSQFEQAEQHHSREATNTSKIGPWKMGETIGFGSSGKVRLAIHERTGQQAAVKIVSKSLFTTLQSTTSTVAGGNEDKDFLPYGIEREIIIMKLLNHPNVLRLFDVWETETDLFMVLEYVEKGELFKLLVEKGPLSEREAIRFFRQIIIGISYCHALGIAHRDLKPENLLLDHNSNIKIADFGMAALETKDKLLETSCGSPHYASPEIVSGMPYQGFESDVWSCGVILYALLTGVLPFDEENGDIRKILLKVQTGKFYMPQNISLEAQDLLQQILTVDPKKRIGTRDILRHPLLKKYPSIKDSMSIRNLPREDTYLNPLDNNASIDQSILNNLVVLWNGKDRREIIKSLKEPGANLEKTFYGLLYNFKVGIQQQHKILEDYSSNSNTSDRRSSPQKQKRYSSSGMPKSTSKRLSTISVTSNNNNSNNSARKQNGANSRPTSQYLGTSKHGHSSSPSNVSSDVASSSQNSGSIGSTPLKRNGTVGSTYLNDHIVVDDGLSPSRNPPPPPAYSAQQNQIEQPVVTNKRISKSISKRLSRNLSRNSMISIQEANLASSSNSSSTAPAQQQKSSRSAKHGSITTKLIATYAKLNELHENDWGYIEQETRRTSQTFATLIDEVFEYEKHEQQRQHILEQERLVREEQWAKEQDEIEKERLLLLEEKNKMLALQTEEEKLKLKEEEKNRVIKVMKKRHLLASKLDRIDAQIEEMRQNLDDEALEYLDSLVFSDIDEDELDSNFTLDDYERDSTENKDILTSDSQQLDIRREEQEQQQEQMYHNDNQTGDSTIEEDEHKQEIHTNNGRSVSEPAKSVANKTSTSSSNAAAQKRAFSLSTRPVSRLDPGIYGYDSQRQIVSSVQEDEEKEGKDSSDEYESEEEEETIVDEVEVERRMVESLRRSKFLGSQFDLAMKLATSSGTSSNRAAKRRSLLAIQSQYGNSKNSPNSKKNKSGKRKSKRLSKKPLLLLDGDTMHSNDISDLNGQSFESNNIPKTAESENTVVVHDLQNENSVNKLSDIVVPKVAKKKGDDKRLSILSSYSSTNLAQHLKQNEERKLDTATTAVDENEKFLFENKDYEDGGEVEVLEETNGEVVKSRSSQMRLNFADRFKGSDNEEEEEKEEEEEEEDDDEGKDRKIYANTNEGIDEKRKVSEKSTKELNLPELPPLDAAKSARNSLMLEKKLEEKNKNVEKFVESVEKGSPQENNINESAIKVAKNIKSEKQESNVNKEPAVQRKKSGIFRIFTPSSTDLNESFKKQTTTANITSASIHHGDNYSKIRIRKEKASKVMDELLRRLQGWEKSKVGLKHVFMSNNNVIKGGISNENVLSLRSTTFQINVDASNNNIITINKMSGSNKTFQRLVSEVESWLVNNEYLYI